MFSIKKKFAFVHIPKTAGTSIADFLHCCVSSDARFEIKHETYGHIKEFLLSHGQDPSLFFTFAVVRNPWDRVVSFYHWHTSGGTPEGLFVPGFSVSKKPVRWPKVPFKEFVLNAKDYLTIKWQTINQWSYLIDPDTDELPANIRILKYDRLQEDFSEMCEDRGWVGRLKHTHKTVHKHYSKYYDVETVEAVRKLFAVDVEKFGFTFGE